MMVLLNTNLYPYLVAIHIIFIVTWFAALFYIVRLMIYHVESLKKPDPDKTILGTQFAIMEKRLMRIIGNPSMILVVLSGSSLLWMNQQFIQEVWMLIKLFLVVAVIIYHFYCLRIISKLSTGILKLSSQQLRLINELATVFLVAIVFLVELKNAMNMLSASAVFILLIAILFLAVTLYKRHRSKINKKAE